MSAIPKPPQHGLHTRQNPALAHGLDHESPLLTRQNPGTYRTLYEPLVNGMPTEQERAAAADFLQDALRDTAFGVDDLPASGAGLIEWM